MLSQFAERLIQFILIGIVYKIAPGSTTQLAKMLIFTAIPAFLVSPIAGVYVDRFNKKHVLIFSDLIRAIMVLFIGIFLTDGTSLVPIYIIVFIIFSSACFFIPARLSIIPELTSKDNILTANSFAMISWIGAGAIGFTTGAFIVEFMGIRLALFINAFLYLLSALVIIFLPEHIKKHHNKLSIKKVTKELENIIKNSFIHELKEGMVYFFKNKSSRFVLSIFFIFMSLLGALYVVGIVFIQEQTGLVTAGLGLMGFFFFLGFLIGSYFYGKLGTRYSRKKIIFLSFILSGLSISLFAFALKGWHANWPSYIILLLLGIAISPVVISSNTIIHETIDHKMRGRVFSSIGVIMNGGFAIFMYATSYIAELVSNFSIIFSCGILLSIIGVSGYFFTRKITI